LASDFEFKGERRMQRPPMLKGILLALALLAALLQPARADFELTDSTGRRIVLRDNGTWKYVDAKEGAKDKDAAAAPAPPEVQADLQLLKRIDAPGGCQFIVMLTNNLPYEIDSLVPDFAAQRANGIVYASKGTNFGSVRPGNRTTRQLLFEGIGCQDIAKLQVVGGDRCEMGELNKFTDAKGRCLALVRVVPSDLLKFEK
jgi:hypothetical protein